jgi:predicted acetyltransferase
MSTLEECKALYSEAFFDDDNGEFANELFNNCFQYCKFLEVEKRIVSMLFALPCEIVFENSIKEAFYVFAVATKAEERGKGYMSKLMDELKSGIDNLLFLRPANKALINMYAKYGFETVTAHSTENVFPFVRPLNKFKTLAEKYKTDDNSTFTAMYYSPKGEKLENLNFAYSME